MFAIVAMALLGFYPGFGAEAKKTQSDVYWRAANPIGITDYTKQGQVLTLVLFNNDAQGSVTVKEVWISPIAYDLLLANVKIPSGTAAKVSLALPASEACSGSDSFEYKITFKYDTQDGTSYTQEGVSPLIGRCSSDEYTEEFCSMCGAVLCCQPAACVNEVCGSCGDGIADAGETCTNCISDVPCSGTCISGVCQTCIAAGAYGCDAPVDCCGSLTCSLPRGVCTSPSAGICSDGTCNPNEMCGTCGNPNVCCQADCGVCPVVCGDTFCNFAAGETCVTCDDDCGVCAFCGDGNCMPPTETCENCAGDCGICPFAICNDGNPDTGSCALCPNEHPSGCDGMTPSFLHTF